MPLNQQQVTALLDGFLIHMHTELAAPSGGSIAPYLDRRWLTISSDLHLVTITHDNSDCTITCHITNATSRRIATHICLSETFATFIICYQITRRATAVSTLNRDFINIKGIVTGSLQTKKQQHGHSTRWDLS